LINEYGSNFTEVQENEKKYVIYFSNEIFSGGKKTCGNNLNYTLGTYSKEKIAVYEKIKDLNNNYDLNYSGLKSRLGITNDFLFSVNDLIGNEKIGVDKKIPSGIDVEAREIPIRVINSSGQIQELILKIRAW